MNTLRAQRADRSSTRRSLSLSLPELSIPATHKPAPIIHALFTPHSPSLPHVIEFPPVISYPVSQWLKVHVGPPEATPPSHTAPAVVVDAATAMSGHMMGEHVGWAGH